MDVTSARGAAAHAAAGYEPGQEAEGDILVTDAAAMKRAAKAAVSTIGRYRPGSLSPKTYRCAVLVMDGPPDTAHLYVTDGQRALRWRTAARGPADANRTAADAEGIVLDVDALRTLGGCRRQEISGAAFTAAADGGAFYRLTPATGDPRRIAWQSVPAAPHVAAATFRRIFADGDAMPAWDVVGVPRTKAIEALASLPETDHGLARISVGRVPAETADADPGRTVLELRATNASTVGPLFPADASIDGRTAAPPGPKPLALSTKTLHAVLKAMRGPKIDMRIPYGAEPVVLTGNGGAETVVLQQLRFDDQDDLRERGQEAGMSTNP